MTPKFWNIAISITKSHPVMAPGITNQNCTSSPPLPFSRGVIFTRAHVSLALPSLRKNGGLLVVYIAQSLIKVTQDKVISLDY